MSKARLKVSLLAAAAAALAMVSVAEARTDMASSGRAVATADQSCFGLWYSSVTNNCGTQKTWEMPLAVDNSNNKTVNVNAFGASSSNNVGCAATGVDAAITSVWASSTIYLPAFGSSQNIAITGAYVPPGGGLYATCIVNSGGRVNVVNWNP